MTRESADRKLREIAGIQDGLVRELLDQKMLIKKLETEIGNLTKQLEDVKKTAHGCLLLLLLLPFLKTLWTFLLFPESRSKTLNSEKKTLQHAD